MASSGKFVMSQETEYYSTEGTIEWEIVSQSAENLTSTVKFTWDITHTDEAWEEWVERYDVVAFEFNLWAGGKKVVEESYYSSSGSGEQEVVISHNADGTGSMSVQFSILVFDDTFTTRVNAGNRQLSYDLDTIVLIPTIKTASNFTDEENPVITYYNPAGNAATALEACISLTGGSDDIAYRSISKTGSSYTFNLTEDERNVLRKAAINSQSIQVRFYLRITVAGERYFTYLTRNFTVANCNPVLSNPVVKNMSDDVSNLTGSEDTLIRYVSMVEYSYEITTQKYATIAEQFIQNGSKKISGLNQGVIDDVESGTFIFSVTDSRGLNTTRTIEKDIVEYVKPTCNQIVKAELVGETDAQIALTISGNYFNDTFGAVDNTLKLEVRHTQNDGTMGDWVDLTDGLIPVFNGNTYTLDITISGFDYSQAYTFQCRATDKLYTVETASYTVRALPVFDWGEEDFNFNVPVNISAPTLNMNGETVLRHTGSSTNNTVLSASGGHIYIRPGGTTDTSSEVRITAQGDIEVKGDIIINGVSLTTILQNAGLM